MAEVLGYTIERQAGGMFLLSLETPRTTFLGRVLNRSDFLPLGRFPTFQAAVEAMRHHVREGDGMATRDAARFDPLGRFLP